VNSAKQSAVSSISSSAAHCELTRWNDTFLVSSLPGTIMWKWLGGCLVVVVVVLAIGFWSAYRKLSQFSGPNKAETVAITAPVTRVFASIADGDSLSSWMAEGMGVRASHHGMLVPGDAIDVGANMRF